MKGVYTAVRRGLAALCGVCVAAAACCGIWGTREGRGAASFVLVSWNVQCFFDAETDGSEYAEFRGASSRWSRERYEERLDRLAESLVSLDGDIVVLQELENSAVVQDVYNRLQGSLFGRRRYRYAAFAKEPGSAIGCGVLSRVPLERMRLHAVADKTCQTQPELRPLMELTVNGGGDARCSLFVCHWKSLSGGAGQAAFWQERQEAVAARRAAAALLSAPVVVCGDFNRDAGLFAAADDAQSVFRDGARSVRLFNAWLRFAETIERAGVPGSYRYRGEWKRYDCVFAAGAVSVSDFAPCADGPWMRVSPEEAAAVLEPYAYSVYSGAGYSDHVPVRCTLVLQGQSK